MNEYILIVSIVSTLCCVVGFINASCVWSAKDSWIKQIAKLCTVIASSVGLTTCAMIIIYLIQMD